MRHSHTNTRLIGNNDAAPADDNASNSSCPLAYRYRPRDFLTAQTDRIHTAYVIGGLYGNTEALDVILALRDAEAREGRKVDLVFNGDYNWFDIDEDSFCRVNKAALQGLSIRGNVEAEMASGSDGDCGCNYPDYVNPEYAARSNAIMNILRQRARQHPDICSALQQLPFIRVLEVGDSRVGIVHGDAQSLAGWDFAAERLSPIGKCCSGDETGGELTSAETLERCFRDANVHAFASTHTCLPHAKDYTVDGLSRLIINNGAAGMPNFAGTGYGLITRISQDTAIPADSLYGITINDVRFDAIPVRFDTERWIARFLSNWPPESPAHIAYFNRIVSGPDFELNDAVAGSVSLYRS